MALLFIVIFNDTYFLYMITFSALRVSVTQVADNDYAKVNRVDIPNKWWERNDLLFPAGHLLARNENQLLLQQILPHPGFSSQSYIPISANFFRRGHSPRPAGIMNAWPRIRACLLDQVFCILWSTEAAPQKHQWDIASISPHLSVNINRVPTWEHSPFINSWRTAMLWVKYFHFTTYFF